jgi:hypothetical protein
MLNRKTHKTSTSNHYGLKILFDGYLIAGASNPFKLLIINAFLFDGYLTKVIK